MSIRAFFRISMVMCCFAVSACNGGNPGTVPTVSANHNSPQNLGSESSSGNLEAMIPRDVIPAYQPSPSPNEELVIMVTICTPVVLDVVCDSSQPYFSLIQRSLLSSGAPLDTIQLQCCGKGSGATQTIASAGDQYFLSSEPAPNQLQVEVDKPTGLVGTIPNTVANLMLMSSDLTTALVVDQNGRIGVYRAPFLHATGGGTQPNGFEPATNSNGSQMFVASSNGTTMTATIYSISTHTTSHVSWRTDQQPSSGTGLYDARHAWYYVISQQGQNGPSRIQILDTAHGKYLGYINLPGSPSSASVNAISSDLYVSIGNSIYVYNVGKCGCTVPRRVLPSPFAHPSIVIDRNNEHLIAYQVLVDPQLITFAWQFADVNPQTGAVQRQYTPIEGDNISLVVVNSVLAQ